MSTHAQPQLSAPASVFGPVRLHSTRTDPLRSDVSTADTVGILGQLAHRYKTDPSVHIANAQAFSGLSPYASDREKACAVFHWIRGNVRFIEDEALLYSELGFAPERLDKELLIVPPALMAMKQPMGDCDDFSLLAACMLLNIGIRPYFVTVAADRSLPRKFSHIYVCARLEDEDGYLCLDAGNRLLAVAPGWEIETPTRKAIWRV